MTTTTHPVPTGGPTRPARRSRRGTVLVVATTALAVAAVLLGSALLLGPDDDTGRPAFADMPSSIEVDGVRVEVAAGDLYLDRMPGVGAEAGGGFAVVGLRPEVAPQLGLQITDAVVRLPDGSSPEVTLGEHPRGYRAELGGDAPVAAGDEVTWGFRLTDGSHSWWVSSTSTVAEVH